MSVLLSAPVLRDLAYEKVKETLSVIPEEVVDKVGLENLGVQESSVQVGLRAKTYSHTLQVEGHIVIWLLNQVYGQL